MKRFKTGILFNIISLTLSLSAIVIGVYSATMSQVNISGSLGYVKHERSFTVSFVKGTKSDFTGTGGLFFDFSASNFGTIEYQLDENGTWVNLIQNDDLVSSISEVESSIQFRLTGKRSGVIIAHYAILNNNKEVVSIIGWPCDDAGVYDSDAVITTDLISVSSNTTFIIGCVIES